MICSRRNLIPLLGMVLIMSAAAPARAGDELNVVVLGFRGPAKLAKNAQLMVSRIVRAEHSLIPKRSYTKARRSLRVRGGGEETYARVAKAIDADVVITATVTKKRRSATLLIDVRDGVTGKIAERVTITLPRKKLTRKVMARTADKINQVLEWLEPRKAASPAQEEDDEELEFGDEDDDETDDDEPGDDEPDDASDDDEESAPLASGSRAFAGSANLGIAMVGRDLRFTVQRSISAEMQPMSYQGAPVGSAHLNAELYPFLKKSRHMSRLGLAFVLERALRVNSRIVLDGVARDFDTTQSRWGVGARYRLPVGKHSLALAAGYDRLSHAINTNGLALDLPNVSYSYVDVGGGLAIVFGNGDWTLNGDARYLHVLSAGEIAEGSAYGGGTVAGVHVDGNMARKLDSGVIIRGGIEYLRMAFAFDGSGAMTDIDSDPDQDVGGAADVWFGAYVTAGVAL